MHHTAARPTRARSRRGRLAAATTIVLLAAAACGGGDSGGDSAGGDGDAASGDRRPTTTTAAPPAGAEPTCEDGSLEGRRFVLCTAGDAPGQGLVVALHGRGSSADEMRAMTELERAAAAEGLAVAYPDAVDGGWGDDTFTTPTRPAGDEDVAFLDHLVERLRADPRLGDGPVGVVGFSNGASMALRYAAERPDDVRAVVSVAGQLPRDPAIRPSQPVPLLEVYGTADPLRGYDTGIPDTGERRPGEPTPTLPTADTVAAFVDPLGAAEHEGPTEADATPDDGTRLRTERWRGDDGTAVVLHTVVDGGHTWPSARTPPSDGARFGPVSRDLDATAEAVAFVLDS